MITKFKNVAIGMLFALTILSNHETLSQTTGDYRSAGSGSWGTLGTWERFNGTSWVTPTVGQGVPGALTLGTNVTIQSTHTVNANVGTTLNLGNITLNGSGAINFNTNAVTITASGTLTMDGTSQISGTGTNRILSVGALSVPASATNANLSVQTFSVGGSSTVAGNLTIGSDTGVKSFFGTVTNTGTWNSTAIATSTNLVFQHGISNSGIFSAGGANFISNSSNSQSLSGSGDMSFANIVTLTTVVLTNNNTGTVTFSNTGAGILAGTGAFVQGTNSSIVYAGSTITVTTFTATATGNTVNYSGATPTIRAVNYYNLTHSGTGTVTVAGISIAGDFTESSTGTFNFTGSITFTGSSNQNINGPGTITFVNMILSTTGSVNVLVNKSIAVTGTISWTANGLLVVGSSADVTLGTAAAITSPNSSRYIQLDGSSSVNSNLVRTSGNNTTNWAFTFPVGSSTGGYTPVTIPTINTAPTANSTLSVKPIVTGDLTGRLKRTFRLTTAGNANATTFSNAVFNYSDVTDVSSGDAETDYTTGWLLISGGTWGTDAGSVNTTANTFTITGGSSATAPLTSGTYYYTCGSTINAQHTWYSYQTGNYSDFNTWTLDPSGTTFDNSLNIYPAIGDEIHILNGFTVTMDINAQSLSATTIDNGGILDVSTTTSQNFGTITGAGLLKIKSAALPTGTYTDFVATTGGTIEFYDIGGTLSTSQTTFNKLKMTNSTSTNITYVLISNLTVNGTFNLSTTGSGNVTWQINDASNNQRTITLNGDLTVGSGGKITVGTGNQSSTTQHAISMYGNFTNSGIVQFFDPTDANLSATNYGTTYGGSAAPLYTAALRGNAATVTFTGTTNNTVTCNGQTDFYRFVLNKGTGQQAILTVNSSSTSNYRLFGPTNQGSSGNGTAPNEISGNSLSIVNGTLQLTGSINITNLDLSGGNDYFSIPQNGALWLNGAGVTVTVANYDPSQANTLTRRLMVNGLCRITAGTLDAGISAGIGAQDGGTYQQEGGTVKCWQFRPRASGSGIFAFIMTGGTLNVGYSYSVGQGYDNTSYCRFDLNLSGSTFQMSGGTMNIAKPVTSTTGGLFNVVSAAGNYSVTGGTVNLYTGYVSGTTENFGYINSTAPLYNVNIFRESGASSAQLQNLDLTVLNDLVIDNSSGAQTPVFILTSGTDRSLTVGGNFNIQSGTTFTPGTISTVTFNGTSTQTWTHNGTITRLVNVVVNKSAGTLTLAGANTFPNITGATTGLTITSGTLADGGKTITVDGAISNSGTHSGSGKIVVTTAATIGGNNGTFGNLRITKNGSVTQSGNQTITGALELNGSSSSILNIGANSLTANGTITTTGTFGTSYFIQTSGLYNAGGLTRKGAAGDILFPVGISALYTPNTINVSATTHGSITVRPVNSEHPNVSTTGVSLKYFWRVTSSGYSAITSVSHKTYSFNNSSLIVGSTAQKQAYRSARWDASGLSWATNNTTYDATSNTPNPNTTVIPNFNTGTSWSGVTGDQLDGEYTCGNVAAFGGVQPYYSQGSGAWNAASGVWTSNANHATGNNIAGPPCANCPVVIGDGASINHTITIDANNRTCGTLAINTGSTLDCSSFTGLNFGTNTGGAVTGRGTIRVSNSAFPTGDFTNFIGSSGGTVEWYGTTKTIPATYTGPGSTTQSLTTYYNLILNPNAGQTLTLPATLATIYNNLTEQTGTGTVTNGGAMTLTVTGNLVISSGTFTLTNSGNSSITVGGSVTNSGTFQTTSGTHTLTVTGGITNNNVINFNNTGTIALTFTGSSNVNFTGPTTGVTTTLYTVKVDKGSSQTPTVTFGIGGTVNTTAAATGWLTLTNGSFDFANTSTVSTTLSTSTYTIPSTAKLRVSGSAVTLNTTSGDLDANDLFLSGALEVAGGSVLVGNQTVNTNSVDIEYAAAGTPTITVSSGSLWVKASVRRSTSTLTGALFYNQTGGTVTVGGIASTDNPSRGVFEIDANTGSNFTLTGTSSLIVQRQCQASGNTGYADLFINPITSNVSSTSTITIGLSSTATAQSNLRINIKPTIGNFTIGNGTGTSAQAVKMYSNSLNIGSTLTIPTPSSLTTNSLNVFIAGDLVCTGTYTGGTNTTTFNGTGAQSATLSTNTIFYNFTVSKTAGSTLTLSGTNPTAPAVNNLNILTGILDVGPLDLSVGRNITINSSQIGTGSVLIYSTTAISNTITSSGGSFTNLKLAGTATSKTISVSGDLIMNGTLTFSVPVRYLMIGSNELTFGSATSATVSGASSANGFISTNGVSSDLGITKIWPVGTNTFIYQVGTSTNYTPVSFSLNVSQSGDLNVVPVNSAHLTYNQASSEQILNYYWTINRGSTLLATKTADHIFNYPSTLITGSGSASLYAAYLDTSNPVGWVTSAHGGTATTTQMNFTPTPASNIPSAGFSYDYTVGTPNTLPNPIVPLYSRKGLTASVGNLNVGGNWTTASNWTTDSDGDLDLNNPSSVVPNGVPVVIVSGSRMNMNSAGRRAYKTTINGLLVNSGTAGHNLGTIDGTGSFRTSTSTFPAGTYTNFVSSGGGTIEYASGITMNNRSTYNNLLISSSVTTTATALTINGNLTISTGNSLNNSVNNADISIAGNWVNNGTFTSGTGKVTFNGTLAQSTTGSTTFNDLTVNKTGNLTLGNTTTVNGTLTMTSGNIISNSYPSTPRLQLASTATVSGGSTSSFIDGQIRAFISNGNSLIFPVGGVAVSRYRPTTVSSVSADDTWDVSYVGKDPSTDGYSHSSFNSANMAKVSAYEYWMVSNSSGTTTAGLTLSYGTGSYGSPDIGTVSSLKTARWNGTQWDVPPGGGTFSQTGTSLTGTVSVSFQNAFSPQTLASTDPASALPIELLYFKGEEVQSGVELSWKTTSELNNDYFTIYHSSDGEKFDPIGTVKGQGTTSTPHSYSLLDGSPVLGKNYYRLAQTDFDGTRTSFKTIVVNVEHVDPINIKVYPNPLNHSQTLSVELTGMNPNQAVDLQLVNMQGIVLHNRTVQSDSNGTVNAEYTPTEIASGLYILRMGGATTKIVIK